MDQYRSWRSLIWIAPGDGIWTWKPDGQERRYNDFLAEGTASHYGILFRLMAVGCAAVAFYHLAALAIPAFDKIAYSPGYPPLRHVTFVIVDSFVAFLFLLRPRWFIWPYLALTAQVLRGHGVRGWQTWVHQHQLNWIDTITVLGTVLGLILLLLDRTSRTPEEFTSDKDGAPRCEAGPTATV